MRPSRAPAATASLAAALAASIGLAGCGQGSPAGSPPLAAVPLAARARVLAQVRRCDPGAHAYCSRELVVAVPGVPTYGRLELGEAAALRAAGFSAVGQGDTVLERAAESRGGRWRVTYAAGADDLRSVELGTIARSPVIVRTLARGLFARRAELSLVIQAGSG